MNNWSMLGTPKETVESKPEIFKDYVLPVGALLIPTVSFLAQNNSPWWGSLAIAIYVVIVLIFLVVPAIIRGIKKWKIHSAKKQSEVYYLPKVAVLLRRFKPMMESSRSDTVWGVWSNGSRTSEMQTYIRPNH